MSRLDSASSGPSGSQAMYRESVSSITYADEKSGGEFIDWMSCVITCVSSITYADDKADGQLTNGMPVACDISSELEVSSLIGCRSCVITCVSSIT